ncbi:MAG: hypothetical protein ACO1Q7_20690 [Gemmatimonas sp.]
MSVALTAACDGTGKGLVDPPAPKAGITIVAGATMADTVDAKLSQPLVVEVRDLRGQLVRGTLVRFDAKPPQDTARYTERWIGVCNEASPCTPQSDNRTAFDTTDATGRASAIVRMGHVAGPSSVRITVVQLDLVDSVTLDTRSGNVASVRVLTPTVSVAIGRTASVGARALDRFANPVGLPVLTLGAGSAVTLNAVNATVTGVDFGTQYVFATFGVLKFDVGQRASTRSARGVFRNRTCCAHGESGRQRRSRHYSR